MATNKHQNQEQGKKSTADTNASYNKNAKDLKNSATTSQGAAGATGTEGVGGVMREKDKKGTSQSERSSGKQK